MFYKNPNLLKLIDQYKDRNANNYDNINGLNEKEWEIKFTEDLLLNQDMDSDSIEWLDTAYSNGDLPYDAIWYNNKIGQSANFTFIKFSDFSSEFQLDSKMKEIDDLIQGIKLVQKNYFVENSNNEIKECLDNLTEEQDVDDDKIKNVNILYIANFSKFSRTSEVENSLEKLESYIKSVIKDFNKTFSKSKDSSFKLSPIDIKNESELIDIAEKVKNGNSISIPFGEIELDECNNFLKFKSNEELVKESIVCNISAKSIQQLWKEHQNNLLGLNLRYYVKAKKIDDPILDTIRTKRDLFWFKNNGLVILCDSCKIDNKKLELTNFSIINGGQTTYTIGNSAPITEDNDFYLVGKIIAIKGLKSQVEDEKAYEFANEIANATNQQKPIKDKDLIANIVEIKKVKQLFENNNECRIFLESRRGEYLLAKKKSDTFKLTIKKIDAEKILQIYYSFEKFEPGKSKSGKAQLYKNSDTITQDFKDIYEHYSIYRDLSIIYNVLSECSKASIINKKVDKDQSTKDFLKHAGFMFISLIKLIFIANNIYATNNIDLANKFIDLLTALYVDSPSSDVKEELTELINSEFNKLNVDRLLLKNWYLDSEIKGLSDAYITFIKQSELVTNIPLKIEDKEDYPSNFVKKTINFYRSVAPNFIKKYFKSFAMGTSGKENIEELIQAAKVIFNF